VSFPVRNILLTVAGVIVAWMALSDYPAIQDYLDHTPGGLNTLSELAYFLTLLLQPVYGLLWGIFFAVLALAFPPPSKK
jgi:hypothetical protein